MSRPSLSRFFIIPMLLLAGFIGLFCVIEYRKLSNDGNIRQIINDPVPKMAHGLEVSVTHAEWVFEIYRPGASAHLVDTQILRDTLAEIQGKTDALNAYFMHDDFEREEHKDQVKFIADMDALIATMRQMVPEQTELSDINWREAQKNLQSLLKVARQLSEGVDADHRHESLELLASIAEDEKQRALMAVLVLIAGFVLVLSLLDVVQQYKCNAERVRAAEKYNALLAAALQNTRVGVLIRDMRRTDRPVVFINKAFTQLTGYEYDDVKGDSTGFLFGWNTAPDVVTKFHETINKAEALHFEAQLYRRDGSPFWAEWDVSPLFGEDGALSHYVSLFNDTTEMRQTQEDLMQAKLLAEHASMVKTNFLAMMSHEIRTPINGILGVLKLFHDTKLDAEQKHMLSVASTSSRALNSIINDILDYAKMEAGKIEIHEETFSLKELLDEVTVISQPLIGDKPVDLVLDVLGDVPPYVVGDSARLRQVFLNLLSNAIKFTEKGLVSVRVLALMEQQVGDRTEILMRFEVQDTGLGISPEDQRNLFQEFSQVERSFTRRYGGTGLGLAICKRLVGMMHGEIGVESQYGYGSKFWFMIPLYKGAAATDAETNETRGTDSVGVDPASLKVLLVEDNDTNRLVARRYLEKLGLSLDEAVNGAQAVDMVKATPYDVILMDVSMPIMDGMTATAQIRALGGEYADLPIIALTAHAMEGDRDLCLAAGMTDYLNKPLDFVLMSKMLQRLLNMREVAQALPERKVVAQSRSEPLVFPDAKEIETRLAHVPVEAHKAASPALPLKPEPQPENVPQPEPVLSPTPPSPPPPVETSSVRAAPQPVSPPPLSVAVEEADAPALLFDVAVLERMNADLGGAAVRQITDSFLKDSLERMQLLTSPDLQVIQDTAHTLKSSSANCGLRKFSRLMESLEQASANKDTRRVQSLLIYVNGTYTASCSRLERERERFTG